MRHLLLILLISAVLHLFCLPVYAHKVNVFAWVEGDTVHTESKFGSGKMVKGGKIEVFDHLNQKVAEGTTDDHGSYTFSAPPAAQTLKIVLTASMGHSNHWQITAEELGRETPTEDIKPPATTPQKQSVTGVSPEEIESIVERAIEKKIAPIRAQLAEQAWGLRDIVAGIGYIIGLMGLASYMHYRKAKKTTP